MNRLVAGLAFGSFAFSAVVHAQAFDPYSHSGYLTKNGFVIDASSQPRSTGSQANSKPAQEDETMKPTPVEAKKVAGAHASVFTSGLKIDK